MSVRPFVHAVVVVVSWIASGTAASAQPDVYHELEIPGGRAVLAPLGVPVHQDRGTLLAALSRAMHAGSASPGPSIRSRADDIARDLRLVDEFRNTWLARVPAGGLGRSLTETRQGRDRTNAALAPLGLRLRQRQRVYIAEPADGRDGQMRREALRRVGVDAAGVASAFNAGEQVQPEVAVETMPVPLSPAVLAQAVFQRAVPPRALFGELLGDARAMLLLHGLTALDSETLAFLESSPDLVSRLYRDGPGAFAMFGRSLMVREGQVVPPGPPAARYLWRSILDDDPAQPERFIRALFTRDGGRLAYFYDTIAGLDLPRQLFALGMSSGEARDRPDRVRALYQVFATLDESWRVEAQPFARRVHEPVMALQALQVDAGGAPVGPHWRRFWQVAFSGSDLPADPVRALRDVERDGPIDAAWLAAQLSDNVMQTRADRLDQVLFGQRVFAEAGPESLPAALVAASGVARYRAAMLTLERIGIRNAATYAAVARRAEEIGSIGDERRAVVALTQFQGALALVAQAVIAGSLTGEQADALVTSLAALPLANQQYHAGVVEWLHSVLLPALPEVDAPGEDEMEARLVAGLAGLTRDSRAPAFDWEGERVRPAVGASARRRIADVRQRQGTLSLDTVVQFARLAREIEQGATTLTLEDARRFAVTLREVAAELEPAKPSPLFTDRLPDMRRQIARAISDLARLNRPRDLQRLPRIATPLLATADVLTADVIGSLAYAPHLGEASGAAMLGEDMSRWHDFGLGSAVQETRRRTAWQLPQESTGTPAVPRHLIGAMLNVDLALGRLQLQRIDEDLPAPPSLVHGDITAFTEAVVLLEAHSAADVDRDEIAAAIARGRVRLSETGRDAARLHSLAEEARLLPWRRQSLRWMAEHEPDRVAEVFTVAEVFWLGSPRLTAPDVWGTAQPGVTGCLCLRLPEPSAWETYGGRLAAGSLAARTADLPVRVAELLAELRVPASLLGPVMGYAAQRLIDTVRLWHVDDGPELARQIGTLSRSDVEDFVAALVGRRLLVLDE